jgi:adenylate cyclase
MKSIIIKSLVALLVALVTAIACSLSSVQQFEMSLSDFWFGLRGVKDPPSEVTIVAMDERSYAELKVPLNQAWPRLLHARLLERLAECGVKKVVFDILFLDASADEVADQRLAQAIAKVPTALGAEASMQQMSGAGGSYIIEDLLTPYPPFQKNAAAIGLVGLPSDQGVIRRFLVERSSQARELATLSEVGAGLLVTSKQARPGPRDLINYYGPARTIPVLPFYEVLDTEAKLPDLKGHTVYVGLMLRTDTGPAQKDIFSAPYGGNIFGVEVHATAAANLLDGSWIRRASAGYEVLLAALGVFLMTLALLSLSPVMGFSLYIICALAWALSSYLLFCQGFFLPGVVPILIVSPLILLFSTFYYYLVIRRSEQVMRSAFEMYLSPEMVKGMKDSGATGLGGEKLWATALFTDIVGFTQITEEMPAERVAQMLNDYFTEVMEVVFRNQGTLIKFIGDAVFVIWGAPVKIQNHAEKAIQTALAIDAEVRKFNASERFPALNTRIGINTGPMLVGNLGSKRRFDYTAIGDSVNLASRVEGLNKYLGTTILFTEATKRDAGSALSTLRVATVRVVGKKEVTELYTTFTEPLRPSLVSLWEEALKHFRAQEWDAAEQGFVRVGSEFSALAKCADSYRTVIAKFRIHAPEAGWQGELLFNEK